MSAASAGRGAMRSEPLRLDLFYPIVPDAGWLARLVPLGIKTIQLRLKDVPRDEIRRQIKAGLELCRRHECQLIVNDYWREAIDAGAGILHLGQQDLAAADVSAIKAAGIALGISTHSLEELACALDAAPDYVALGPIYETRLKAMPWKPQGLARIGEWKSRIGDLPLVAIGGITLARAPGILDAGADAAAVITDFYAHRDPEARVNGWLDWARHRRNNA